jgi:chromosomal replication initiation ATPase DnaA
MSTPDGRRPDTREAVAQALHSSFQRPACLVGPSGSGKTTALRAALQARECAAAWTTARDTVNAMIVAMRDAPLDRWRAAFAGNPQLVVIEHLEDLRGKSRTMDELRHVLELRAARGHPTVLTLTSASGADEVLAWLGGFAALVSLQKDAPAGE